MNYTKLSDTIIDKVLGAMALINNPEVAPEVRQMSQEILLREVGKAVYDKVYNMNAYDMEISHTVGNGIDDRYYGLAKIASDSVSAGNQGFDDYVKNYLDTAISAAQGDAFKNAQESGKRPTVTRSIVSESCPWCDNLAGTYTDPGPDVFRRHRGCDCRIETSGYKSRNGLVNNYTKSDQNKSISSQGGLRTENAAQKAMENALNDGNVTKAQQIVDSVQNPDLKAGLQSTIDRIQGNPPKFKVDPETKKIVPA